MLVAYSLSHPDNTLDDRRRSCFLPSRVHGSWPSGPQHTVRNASYSVAQVTAPISVGTKIVPKATAPHV